MIKINTSIRTISGPTSWKEVTLEMFLKLIKATDYVDRLCILYNLDAEELNSTSSPEIVQALEQASSFMVDEPLDREVVPDYIYMGGAMYISTKINVKDLSIGQAINARRAMEKCATYEEAIPSIVSIYIQPYVTGRVFNMEDVKSVEQTILNKPITEVLAVGFFLVQAVDKAWESYQESLDNVKDTEDEEDAFIAEQAGVQSLKSMADLSIIDVYADRYKLDPDYVYTNCSFSSIMGMLLLWKHREAYTKRFHAIKSALKQNAK